MFFFGILIFITIYKYHGKLVSAAKPWLICGYYDLTIVTMVLGFICSKTMVNFRKG